MPLCQLFSQVPSCMLMCKLVQGHETLLAALRRLGLAQSKARQVWLHACRALSCSVPTCSHNLHTEA